MGIQQIPVHPARQQQALGAIPGHEQSQGVQNHYIKGNIALEQAKEAKTGEAEAKLQDAYRQGTGDLQLATAKAAQYGAEAGKAQKEAELLGYAADNNISGMLGEPAIGYDSNNSQSLGNPDILPQEIEAEQIADKLILGDLTPGMLARMLYDGNVSDTVAGNAMALFRAKIDEDQRKSLPIIEQGVKQAVDNDMLGSIPGY